MCKYCENTDGLSWLHDDDNFPLVEMTDCPRWQLEIAANKYDVRHIAIEYCPFCGRDLNKN